jgi:hypothetical protein
MVNSSTVLAAKSRELGWGMSEHDKKAVEANFTNWKADRAADLSDSAAFERYAMELIFKDADLSDEEISSGLIAGGGDGGIDGFYFFINRSLMAEGAKAPEAVESATLWLIQSKNKNSFEESVVQKFESFVADLFDFTRSPETMAYYNKKVKDRIEEFREIYESIIGHSFKFGIEIRYVTRSDHDPAPQVTSRVENVKMTIRKLISSVSLNFEFWRAQELLLAIRSTPSRLNVLKVKNFLMDSDGSFVCLARLDRFAEFLTDEGGALRQPMLEPNVRDYQGRNKINRGIQTSIQSQDINEFWWLNNGITILAEEVTQGAGALTIKAPEIVNGLQTSHELFNYFSANKKPDERTVLVRVILPPDEHTRDRITAATNSQTPVSLLSLHATEHIHYEIEDLLKLYNIFYDRKKGKYRRLKKPVAQIVSIKYISQVVMSLVLWMPNSARGRPELVLAKEETYNKIFNTAAPREVYLSCVLLDRQVYAYLEKMAKMNEETIADIRFYVDAMLGSLLTEAVQPTEDQIAKLAAIVKAPIALDKMTEATNIVTKIYSDLGGTDKIAKGPELKERLIAYLEERLSKVAE